MHDSNLVLWHEQLHPYFVDIERRASDPFVVPVLRAMFNVARTLVKYAESYDLVVGDDVSGRIPAIVTWRLINLRRLSLGLEPAALRLINGRCDAPFPDGFIPPSTSADARAVVVTDGVSRRYSINNLIAQTDGRRGKSGRVDAATLVERSAGLRPEALAPHALYIIGDNTSEADRLLSPDRPRHPAWIGVTKEDRNRSQFAVVQGPWDFDDDAVGRLGQDMDVVVDAFAGLLGMATPEQIPALPHGES